MEILDVVDGVERTQKGGEYAYLVVRWRRFWRL